MEAGELGEAKAREAAKKAQEQVAGGEEAVRVAQVEEGEEEGEEEEVEEEEEGEEDEDWEPDDDEGSNWDNSSKPETDAWQDTGKTLGSTGTTVSKTKKLLSRSKVNEEDDETGADDDDDDDFDEDEDEEENEDDDDEGDGEDDDDDEEEEEEGDPKEEGDEEGEAVDEESTRPFHRLLVEEEEEDDENDEEYRDEGDAADDDDEEDEDDVDDDYIEEEADGADADGAVAADASVVRHPSTYASHQQPPHPPPATSGTSAPPLGSHTLGNASAPPAPSFDGLLASPADAACTAGMLPLEHRGLHPPSPPALSADPPPPSIARRTRANYSLVQTQLTELEALLHTPSPERELLHSPPPLAGSPQGNDVWQQFLHEVHHRRTAEEARPTPSSVDNDDSEDDGDYNYLADSSRLQEGEEEWAEDGDINEEEVVDLVREAREGTKRSARRVPRMGTLTSQPSPSLSRLSPRPPRRSSPAPQTRPGGMAASSRPDAEAAWTFSPEMLRTLQIQMHIHVQLLVQTLVLTREALRKEPVFARASLMAYSLLVELCTHCDITMAYKQLKTRPVYATPLRLPAEVLDKDIAADAVGSTTDAVPPALRHASAAPPESVFEVPGMAFLPQLLFERVGLKPLHEATDVLAREGLLRQLRKEHFDGRHELHRFAPYFNPHYNIRKATVPPSIRFTHAEDRLFALGLRRYGFSNYGLIRALLLPTKTVDQLQSRFESETKRKSNPNNPIKRAKLDHQTVILTSAEETLLARGVKLYGEDWARIRAQMLPHRSLHELHNCWRFKLGVTDGAPPVFAADPSQLPAGIPLLTAAATRLAPARRASQLQDISADAFDHDELSTSSEEEDDETDGAASEHRTAQARMHAEAEQVAWVDSPEHEGSASAQENSGEWQAEGRPVDSLGSRKGIREEDAHPPAVDVAIMAAMLRPGACEGDAVEARRLLCGQGVLHDSYSAQALLNRFRTIISVQR
ncbi:hypothetical protein AB1Y20_009359 [Prymnesium parvum]|uniref:Myb-like domain-containing protein n=1 Tax=Prymnesium parvum TaxID=97485 RepID=A0AB34K0H9_PRYPA